MRVSAYEWSYMKTDFHCSKFGLACSEREGPYHKYSMAIYMNLTVQSQFLLSRHLVPRQCCGGADSDDHTHLHKLK